MFYQLIAAAALSATIVSANPFERRAVCNADDCNRAVGGTRIGKMPAAASRSLDCLSFLGRLAVTTSTTTVYVATETSTATSTATVTAAPVFAKRQAPTIPDYAATCGVSSRYSSACSCFIGGGTATVTVTSSATASATSTTVSTIVTTTTIAPALPTTCGNTGLQYAYVRDNIGFFSDSDIDGYAPARNKDQTPDFNGVTQYLHYMSTENSVYGVSAPTTTFAINHRGYIYAAVTGTYSFTVSHVDDAVYMWIGASAYSGWLKANAAQYSRFEYNGYIQGSGTYTMKLTAGTYYPFRVVYKQGFSVGSFDYSVTDPTGAVVIGSSPSAVGSALFVQYSCDGTTAPAFPAFGSET